MNDEEEPMHNATSTFTDTLPKGIEIIPTVYITIDCLQKPHQGQAVRLVRIN